MVRTSSTASSTRRWPGQLGDLLGQVAPARTVMPVDHRPVVRLHCAGQQPQQRGLARAVHADHADAVARGHVPGHVVEQQLAGRRATRRRPRGRRPCGPAARCGQAQLDVPRGAARRRSAPRPRRCGTSAWTCGPAGRGAARPAPCAAGSGARASVRRGRPGPLGPGQHVGGVAALVAACTWPRATSQVRAQTSSRNQRSWVTTSSAPRRGRQVRGEPGDALDVEVVGRLVEHQQRSASPAPAVPRPGATRRRSPPDSGPTPVSSPCGKTARRSRRGARPARRARARRPAHSCSAPARPAAAPGWCAPGPARRAARPR